MSLRVPPTASLMSEWVRKAADAINFLLGQRDFPFVRLDAAPADPQPGQSYYDTTLNKSRTWNGSAWQNLF